ncbi:hypothetical protein BGZ95_006863, partial [Linnemannia exigua]
MSDRHGDPISKGALELGEVVIEPVKTTLGFDDLLVKNKQSHSITATMAERFLVPLTMSLDDDHAVVGLVRGALETSHA